MGSKSAGKPTLEARLRARERPQTSPVMYQKWRDLLFLHWRCDPQIIQQTLPPGLTVDTHAGDAYLGIVPFFMRDVRPRFCPPVPGISNFMEVNVRTYVYDERGLPGVWFYSLDANQWLAVKLARAFFKLPYYYATMHAPQHNVRERGVTTEYVAWRRGADPRLKTRFRYRGVGARHTAEPGSLEFFLVERYLLFAVPQARQVVAGQVHHTPYPLRPAAVAQWDEALFELNGLPRFGREPDHVLMSPGVDVDIFALEREVTASAAGAA